MSMRSIGPPFDTLPPSCMIRRGRPLRKEEAGAPWPKRRVPRIRSLRPGHPTSRDSRLSGRQDGPFLRVNHPCTIDSDLGGGPDFVRLLPNESVTETTGNTSTPDVGFVVMNLHPGDPWQRERFRGQKTRCTGGVSSADVARVRPVPDLEASLPGIHVPGSPDNGSPHKDPHGDRASDRPALVPFFDQRTTLGHSQWLVCNPPHPWSEMLGALCYSLVKRFRIIRLPKPNDEVILFDGLRKSHRLCPPVTRTKTASRTTYASNWSRRDARQSKCPCLLRCLL